MENSTDKQPNTETQENIKVKNAASTDFRVGDKIVVNYKIKEGDKFRVQPYEGIVIAIKGSGLSKTFTVRRMGTANIGVERIFPLHSPSIDSIEIKVEGKVRRSKLYYLRDRVGKAATKIRVKA